MSHLPRSSYDQSPADRAARRGAGMVLFRPPPQYAAMVAWHVLETHMGRRTLQWRPGIDIWRDDDGQRWTAELAGSLNWTWVMPVPPTDEAA